MPPSWPNPTAATQDILVIELLDPVYDAQAATLAYDAKIVRDYGGRGLANLAQQQTDYELAASFGEGSLFIDDCPDSTDGCYVSPPNSGSISWVGDITSGNCWQANGGIGCQPCGSYSTQCNQTFPDACQGNCVDEIELCGDPGCEGGD